MLTRKLGGEVFKPLPVPTHDEQMAEKARIDNMLDAVARMYYQAKYHYRAMGGPQDSEVWEVERENLDISTYEVLTSRLRKPSVLGDACTRAFLCIFVLIEQEIRLCLYSLAFTSSFF